MNIKSVLVLITGLALFGLYGCTTEVKESHPPTKLITVQDIKDHAEDYDVHYLHTLLRYLAERHETLTDDQVATNLAIAESYYKENGIDVGTELKESIVKAQVYEEHAFLRILGKTYAQVEHEVKSATDIYDIHQFVILGGENVAQLAQQLTDDLQGVVEPSEIQRIYAGHEAQAEIEVTTMSYTPETLPSMFNFVQGLDTGDAHRIGDDNYAGVIHVQSREQATLEKLLNTYKNYVTTSYPDTLELIQAYIETLPVDYTIGEGVNELIYQKIEGLE